MRHIGDITKLNGATLPVVDCITGGSPCQDLSIAGKREGLAGERSGLFMEQVRIVKEMRKEDIRNGRSNHLARPRFLVWENVPGAFSSNGGKDFQAVLTEIVRIAEPEAPDVPLPVKGWPKHGCLYDDMGRWSVAWRLHDAQFWGVPQRRKRIALVADFGGLSAPEVLFERKGLSWHPDESGTEGQGTAPGTERSTCSASGFNGWKSSSGSIQYKEELSPTIERNMPPNCVSTNNQSVLQLEPTPINTMVAMRHNALGEGTGFGVGEPGDPAYTVSAAHSHAVLCLQGNMIDRDVKMNGIGVSEEPMYSLNTVDRHGVLCLNDQGGSIMGVSEDVVGSLRAQEHGHQPCVFDARGNGDGAIACTITGDHQNRVTDYTAIVTGFAQQGFGDYKAGEVASSLKRRDFKDATALVVDVRNLNETEELSGTLQSKNNGGYSLNYQNPVRMGNYVRRLTPLECERLQGYPDGWTDIGEWVDSKGKKHKESSDTARYKALGNSIALPFWFWLMRRISAQYERPATLGSLFDGIGGFPLCWERCNGKGTALWASEIEEFPMAVTKVRFE